MAILRWKGGVVAEIVEGDDILAPRVLVLADESLTGADLEKVQERLSLWLRHLINTQLDQIITLKSPPELEGTARGIAFQLAEHLGILPRQMVANDVKGLDQDVRGRMRKLGIKFGAYHIYVPMSLKPAPRELALILHALKNGGVRQPGVSELPPIILSGRTSFETDPEVAPRLYEIAGFKLAGKRAVRVDILERLADLIRPLITLNPDTVQGEPPAGAAPGNGFRVTVEMTSLLGCAGEDFASILKSLGYRVQRTPLPPEPVEGEQTEAEADQDDLKKLDGASEADIVAEAAVGDPKAEPEPESTVAAESASAPEQTEAEAEQADLEKLDGATPEDVAAAPEAATGDPGAEPETAAEATGEDAAEAEPRFDEIWFPGGRSGDRAHRDRRPRRTQNEGDGKPGEQGQRKPRRDRNGAASDANGSDDGNKAGRRQKPDKRSGKPRRNEGDTGRPRRESNKPFDPDSPFAALAVLKDRQGK